LPLAAILVLTSVISAGYYLPVIMAMYMQPEPFEQAHTGMQIGRLGGVAVAVSVAGLLFLGIRPNRLLDLAKTSGDGLRSGPALPSRVSGVSSKRGAPRAAPAAGAARTVPFCRAIATPSCSATVRSPAR